MSSLKINRRMLITTLLIKKVGSGFFYLDMELAGNLRLIVDVLCDIFQ
jgi:hypothetical protein